MNMNMSFDLTIEQRQKLVMTHELIQGIQILQYNSQELETYIEEQILQNPVLDREEMDRTEGHDADLLCEKTDQQAMDRDADWQEIISQYEYDDISYTNEYLGADDNRSSLENYISREETLHEYLIFQLQLTASDKKTLNIGECIIDSIDDNGYLICEAEDIALQLNIDESAVLEVIRLIHSFDPMGVGARNIKECLKIQLEYMGILNDEFEVLIDEYLENIASNNLVSIAKGMAIDPDKAEHLINIIRSLEPKPGRRFIANSETKYITPDIIVESRDGSLYVNNNDEAVSHLTISSYYRKLMSTSQEDKELREYLTAKINSARWLIKCIDQRKETIRQVASEIVRFQEDFFAKGERYMKPLTLKTIADNCQIHESTVSRAINGKFLQSPMGVYELKYFFNSGIQGSDGNMVSSNMVKLTIKELIDGENHKKPYSDQELVGLLKAKKIDISRRTVAKYRDELGILSSTKRKRY